MKCKECGSSFDFVVPENFLGKVSPSFGGINYYIPEPTSCWPCRRRRRLVFKNERQLYRRKCNKSDTQIVSTFSPEKPFPVVHSLHGGVDGFDARELGVAFGEGSQILSAYLELKRTTPRTSVLLRGSENCEYNNDLAASKDTYLSFGSSYAQNCAYVSSCHQTRDSFDVFKSSELELCYRCCWMAKGYANRECFACFSSSELIFCSDCTGCTDCIGCYRLRNKRHCIFNEQYTQEEYEIQKKAFRLETWSGQEKIRKAAIEFIARMPHPTSIVLESEECVGDMLRSSKALYMAFSMSFATTSSYVFECSRTSWLCDCDSVYDSELVFCTVAADHLYRCAFLENCYYCSDTYYSSRCQHSKNLLLCVGLYRQEYCILNKQYSQEEYEQLAPKVIEALKQIGLWGEFFPPSCSDYGYNESEAQYYFPSERDEVFSWGGNWTDYVTEAPKVSKFVEADKLPDSIQDVGDEILNQAVLCKRSGKPFRIIKSELDFYRKQGIPLPRFHPEERFKELLALRKPPEFYRRNCTQCSAPVFTNIAHTDPEPVYCDKCFAQAYQ